MRVGDQQYSYNIYMQRIINYSCSISALQQTSTGLLYILWLNRITLQRMSFVKTPKRLYDDFTDMQHLRQYSHNAPDVRFVNHNQSSYTGYGQNYDEQNPLHLPHASTNPQTHNLYSTEFHREALPSSILHHPNVNEPWVSYPQNYHVDSTGNYRFPDYPYPSHHLVPPVDPAASRSNFRNAGPVDLDLYSGMQRTLAGSLDPSTGVFYRMPEHPRLRTAQACEKCRTRKAKCSGEHPSFAYKYRKNDINV
ncbi:fungal specific transcription [Lentinula edodes]|uniref:Fungal specific transcription n=1 Tax=Lentinula edodes TaxID=5353 RepID=A0A1Q3E821_LENED|nr:fungal specific transcription [Lentinula edodes]